MLTLAAMTWRVCPTSKCRLTEGGAAISWDNSVAGDELSSGGIATLAVDTAGSGYNGGVAGTLENVDLINTAFAGRSGNSAKATVVFAVRVVLLPSATITQGGENYVVGDQVFLALDNGVGGVDAVLEVATLGAVSAREQHRRFITSSDCAISKLSVEYASFSLDLSRDELDVTTLPLLCE